MWNGDFLYVMNSKVTIAHLSIHNFLNIMRNFILPIVTHWFPSDIVIHLMLNSSKDAGINCQFSSFWVLYYLFQLGGGYLFGLPVGFIADSIGATIGAGAAFLLGRTVSFYNLIDLFHFSSLKRFWHKTSSMFYLSEMMGRFFYWMFISFYLLFFFNYGQIGRSYVLSKLKDYPKFRAVAIAIERSGFKVCVYCWFGCLIIMCWATKYLLLINSQGLDLFHKLISDLYEFSLCLYRLDCCVVPLNRLCCCFGLYLCFPLTCWTTSCL